MALFFYSVDKGGNFKGRLTGSGLYRIIKKLGLQVGVDTHPRNTTYSYYTVL